MYRNPGEGLIANRLSKIEKDLLDRDSAQTNLDKIKKLYEFLFVTNESYPSLQMKLNFVEWKVFHETRVGTLGERISAVENLVVGKPSTEPLAFRLEQLVQVAVESGIVALHKVKVPKGTKILVRLEKQISSKETRAGSEAFFNVANDLFIDENVLVLSKGEPISGDVDVAKRGRSFGRSGHLVLTVNSIPSLDGTDLGVSLVGLAQELDKKKLGIAVAASGVGYLALGPVGLIGGIFVKGKDVQFPAGTEFLVSTAEDKHVFGIVARKEKM
ncbi:hypothetical protein HYY75_09940 [bacterium]|nr:hypothetical protein [bacterium]